MDIIKAQCNNYTESLRSLILICFQVFIPNNTTFTKYCLSSFEIEIIRQYLTSFTGLEGKVNATVFKIEPISTGLGHDKLPWF